MIQDDLRAAGLRFTRARVTVLAVFHRASPRQHLTAEDVFRELLPKEDRVGLGTVYRCRNRSRLSVQLIGWVVQIDRG